MDIKEKTVLPDFFKPILWSYDLARIDIERDKSTIIVNAINYGTLKHLRWLADTYGKHAVRETLDARMHTEIRPQARRLAELIFA
ncbi:MAG: hypothetical protein Q8Q18_02720 [bacterium]|nr:hypothetical protein [bacterium]